MSTIKVTEEHTLGADEAAKRIVAFEEMIKKYGVKTKWKGRHADLKGMGVSGSIDISDDDAQVVVKLGMLAKSFGVDPVKLESSIRKRLKAAFEA